MVKWIGCLHWFPTQAGDFFLNQGADSVLDDIDTAAAHFQGPGYSGHWPFLKNVKVKGLVMFGIDPALDPVDGGVDQVLFPVVIPTGIQAERGIGETIDCGGAGGSAGLGPAKAIIALAFPELVGDTPTGQAEQPTFERSFF